MKNKPMIALVLGGTSGIGLAIAKSLSAQNYKLIIVARNQDNLNKTKLLLNKDYHLFYSIDLSKKDHVHILIDTLNENLPQIVIANYHNRSHPNRVSNLVEDFYSSIETNLYYLTELMKICLPFQENENFGRWVAISSMIASSGGPFQSAYSAHKNVLEAIFRNIAIEESEYNITANVIRAGLIDTEGLRKNYSTKQIEKLCRMNLLKRIGTPEEVAHAVSFYVNPNSSFITGTILPVCGGYDLAWELKK